MNWDDLRVVLAVADEGSVAAAARRLGVNHATVLRRIAAFETAQGLRIFDKTARGYRVSAERRALVETMRSAGLALDAVARQISAERPRASGQLRITSTDTLCAYVLSRIAPDLAAEAGQGVELIAANIYVDFSRLHADIAVRPTDRLPDDLDGIPAGEMGFAAFAAPGGRDAWLGLAGPLQRSRAAAWYEQHLGGARPEITADSFLTLAAMAARGAGRALLPVYVGAATPGLARLDLDYSTMPRVPIWVACHRDLARSGRLLAARRYIASRLLDDLPRLTGQN